MGTYKSRWTFQHLFASGGTIPWMVATPFARGFFSILLPWSPPIKPRFYVQKRSQPATERQIIVLFPFPLRGLFSPRPVHEEWLVGREGFVFAQPADRVIGESSLS